MSYEWFFVGGLSIYGGVSILVSSDSDMAIGISSLWLCLGCCLVYIGATDTKE